MCREPHREGTCADARRRRARAGRRRPTAVVPVLVQVAYHAADAAAAARGEAGCWQAQKKAVSKDSGSYGNKDGMQPYTQLLHFRSPTTGKVATLVLLLVVLGLFFRGAWGLSAVGYRLDLRNIRSLRRTLAQPRRLRRPARERLDRHGHLPCSARGGARDLGAPIRRSSTVSESTRAQYEWDCADAPLGLCSSWCRLTVEVPPGASSAAIQLLQPSGDASHPSVTIGNVTVGSITTAPANTPLPSSRFISYTPPSSAPQPSACTRGCALDRFLTPGARRGSS